jgi:hypothetical protein
MISRSASSGLSASLGSATDSILFGVLVVTGAAIPFAMLLSSNAELSIGGLLALLVATWFVGQPTVYPALLWVVAMNWLQIMADVLQADLAGQVLGDGSLGPNRKEAIAISLCALVVLAAGMRLGLALAGRAVRAPAQVASSSDAERSINLNGALLAFFISYPVVTGLTWLAYLTPGLTQPVLAFVSLKFVCLYLVATAVFQQGRGYLWLTLVLLLELASGLTGFFSSYKEPIFVVLLAAVANRRKLSAPVMAFGAIALVAVTWVSLVWTAVKPEYRFWVSGYTGAQTIARPLDERIAYIAQRMFFDSINYEAAYLKLLRRIGYTDYYGQILARMDAGLIPDAPGKYAAAVVHILTPRVLFPDKATLDDSAITTLLTGQEIGANTSIGVGYMAEAHVDFGFPGMLLPILLVGAMLGAVARYFMGRNAPLIIRQAFATVSIFSAFSYESNIDKALGGFLVAFIGLALALKFGYPMVGKWLMPRVRSRPSEASPVHGTT